MGDELAVCLHDDNGNGDRALGLCGKIKVLQEHTIDEFTQRGEVKEAAEKRMGRFTEMLKKVSAALKSSSEEGPWVLQFQNGELLLGKYELTVDPEKAAE